MQTVADLKQRADRALFEDQYLEALQLYASMVELQPGNLDARLRVADALLALGEAQSAAVVYTALARNAALAGYPLRALVALKVLSALEPKLHVLLEEVARLYARGSERIGRSARRALPESSEVVEETTRPSAPSERAPLCAWSQQLAARYQTDALFYPERLLPIPLLSLLPQHEFASALEVLHCVRVRPDTWILRQGEPGHSFFVVARGTLEVSAERDGQTQRLAQLSDGAIFGEMALLSDAARTASVRALTDCDLLEFDCERLGAATATLRHLKDALGSFAQERLLANVTNTSALFRPLDPQQRIDLVRRFVAMEVQPGAAIIHEAEAGSGLYVVLRGDVRVSRRSKGARSELARLGPSEVFGEISLLTDEPTTASVHAGETGATLLFLERSYFGRLIGAVPELRGYFDRLCAERLLDLRLLAAEDERSVGPVTASEELDVEVLF
jgi:CRP-like cAMP-binding protein